jgi:4'-phosphopantetheinyl transferase
LNNFIDNKDLLKEILSQDELLRVDRFHFEIDKDRYICSHGILRLLISIYLGISHPSINFSFNAFGKPLVNKLLNKSGFQFNLSHSENFAYFSFTQNSHIGVDIEFLGSIPNFWKLAERYFSKLENHQLLSISEENFQFGFYNCGTSKEAVIKALGEGLSFPLKDFNVNVEALSLNQIRNYTLEIDRLNAKLFIETFRTHNDFIGACAVNGNVKSTTYWFCEDCLGFTNKILNR